MRIVKKKFLSYNEAKGIGFKSPPKNKTKVKSHIRKNHSGTSSFIQQYTRRIKKRKSNYNEPTNKSLFDKSLDMSLNDTVIKTEQLNNENGGVNDVYKITMKDKNNNEHTAFFKPIKGEQFTHADPHIKDQHQMFRGEVVMRDKKSDQPLTIEQHREATKLSGRESLKKYKGQLIKRELMAALIGKELGIRMPNSSISSINGELGFITKNIHEQFKSAESAGIHETIQSKPSAEKPKTLTEKAKNRDNNNKKIIESDPEIGNMGIFDFLIGNTDRHATNYMVDAKKNGEKHAISFDHGMTFPSKNGYIKHFFEASSGQNFPAKHVKPMNEFVEQFQKLADTVQQGEIVNHIRNEIGNKEAMAFIQRTDIIHNAIAESKKSNGTLNDFTLMSLCEKLK